jgi:hypothetical protein
VGPNEKMEFNDEFEFDQTTAKESFADIEKKIERLKKDL